MPPTEDNADAVVIPFGYEGTVTYGHGAAEGPNAIIQASTQVETFDDELKDDIQNHVKIWTAVQPKLPEDAEEASKTLKETVSEVIKNKKLPVVIGGEHSISFGFAQALNEHYKDISVLVFDSHLDLGDQWSSQDFTHAAWLKYSLELSNIKSSSLVGIRNFNKLEYNYWQENKDKVNVFLAKEKKNWKIKEIVDSLSDNVYISFDVDAFDSSVMPATGTPEPGGLFWDDVLPILREVAKTRNIIGMDLVELAPIKGMHAPDFIAAKLLMKMILYKFKAEDLI
ncbi:MAG: agmatinase [bacterium]|nr:agmatinase [bacterium]